MPLAHPLDRPAFAALTGLQQRFAINQPNATRLHPDIGLFMAALDTSMAALNGLRRLITECSEGALFEAEGNAFDGWLPKRATVHRRVVLYQMLWAEVSTRGRPSDAEVVFLNEGDAHEIFELADITRPGPFRPRTHALGDFMGVRRGGRLVAVAGQRLKMDGAAEISAVCTLPRFRGQGLASALIRRQVEQILLTGSTPFLHAAEDNPAAIALYERLGFRPRQRIAYVVVSGSAP